MEDPRTRGEWQEALDCAESLLGLEAARQHGLVTGGPGINVARCQEILAEGKQRNFFPDERNVASNQAALLQGEIQVTSEFPSIGQSQSLRLWLRQREMLPPADGAR